MPHAHALSPVLCALRSMPCANTPAAALPQTQARQ